MSVKAISRWLKFIIVVMALMCFGIQCAISLIFLVSEVPEIGAIKVPWLIFIWTTAIPMIPAVISAWETAKNIGKDVSFSIKNAKNLHTIAMSAAADCAIVSIGNIALLIANMNHPSVVLASMVIVVIGIAILIAAEGLSQLIKRAAKLQDDADLTI